MYNKVNHLTNNPQEAFNSSLNKIVQVKQPNPNALVIVMMNVFHDAEMKVTDLKVITNLVHCSQYLI